MRKIIKLLILGAMFFLPSITLASALPPQYAVNNQSKECSMVVLGDECFLCQLPDDWFILENGSCPGDYRLVEIDLVNCQGFKNAFCCTAGHSGAVGFCDDLVVNYQTSQCAFVKDINDCQDLPIGWQRAEIDYFGETVCPSGDFEWLDNYIECQLIDASAKDDNLIGSDKEKIKTNLYVFGAVGLLIIGLAAVNLIKKN